MNEKRYLNILIFIVAVIVTVLSIQVYWNIKSYEDTASQVHRDLQTALDKSIEDYFTIQAKRNTVSFFNNDKDGWSSGKMKKVFDAMDLNKNPEYGIKMIDSIELSGITFLKGTEMDSVKPIKNPKSKTHIDILNSISNSASKNQQINKDSAKIIRRSTEYLQFEDNDDITGEIKELTNKLVFSMTSNHLNLERLDSLYKNEILSKDITVDYQMRYNDGDSLFIRGDSIYSNNLITSESAYFYKDASLQLYYAGQGITVLKRGLTGILLSTLLILAVISCLFYMLFVIRQQKQLSLIKNDLISNITHEFKTPIATASAALEGVQNFTVTGDVKKSDRYLTIGREQLVKLNLMVEKLLETATIDSQNLALQKTELNITQLTEDAIGRYGSTTDKTIFFNRPEKDAIIYADAFHIENAINNLIDNAVKYGGDRIDVAIETHQRRLSIEISDTGTDLKSKNAKYLFDKFYRVPQGDRHTVKGHGIGLFYTKAIIEKHGGTISLSLNPTTFTILLPNG